MQEIKVSKLHDYHGLVKQMPNASQFKRVINSDTILIDNGKPVAVYIILKEEQVQHARVVLKTAGFTKNSRTGGPPTKSAVYGALPRVPLRVDYCRYTNNSYGEFENFKKVISLASCISGIYKKYLPEEYERCLLEVGNSIDSHWRSSGTPFTTYNFNINHAIKYHYDTGNFKGHFSNVLILKKNMAGGELVLPDYEIAFSQQDMALIIFDGQKILHGVMPITPLSSNAYRASIVCYTMAAMKHCYPFQKELERIAKVKTERARKRLSNNRPELVIKKK